MATNYRSEKISAQIAELAARFFSQTASPKSLLTVTGCDLSPDGHRVFIRLSVMPEELEGEALIFARRKRTELRDFIKSHSRMNTIPHLEVVIDQSRRIEEILKNNNQD